MLLSAAKAMILIALNIVLFDSKCRILEGWLATSIKTLMFLLNGYSQKEGFLILKEGYVGQRLFQCVTFV